MRHDLDYGAFEIDSFPGNFQIAICHHFLVLKALRGKGLGHALKQHQDQILNQAHYGYALSTVAAHNTAQIRCMTKSGWILLDTFWNERHGEMTTIWDKRLDAGVDPRAPSTVEVRIDFWRSRALAAEAWYRDEFGVDPRGEGIDVVYPWDHTGDKDDKQT